jgi:deoxyadenosine/deoxycytidine kinase
MHIAVAGNIGSGKTTLTGLLARNYGWEARFEPDNTPYLDDFYEDMERWSFNLQVYFLNQRLKGIVAIRQARNTIIQDRTIYEDACIFAPNLHAMGLMNTRDYHNYRSLFDLMMSLVAPPDLIVYLKASVPTLVNQIQKRGCDYEARISSTTSRS